MKAIRRPIFLLIAFLCAVNVFAQNTAPVATTNAVVQNAATNPVPLGAGWVARHQGFVAQAKQGGIDILFMGDSITDFWRNRGSNVWNQNYAPRHAANFGISGDRTQHVLWRMDNGELDGIKPKVVVLMIGTNNTGGTDNAGTATAAEIAEGIGAVVLEMRNDFPQAKILLLAVFPRGVPGDSVRDKIAEINRIVSKLDDQRHVFYLDIGPKFLDEKGNFLPDAFRPDNLHPLAKGYDIWGAAVKDRLAELMK